MVGEIGDSQIVVNLPVTSVPGCIGSNAKTIGLQYLQFLDMGASGADLVQKIPALLYKAGLDPAFKLYPSARDKGGGGNFPSSQYCFYLRIAFFWLIS
jgi:hypothetical protein